MKNIHNYLTEKLHVGAGMKSEKLEDDDPRGWNVGDILVSQWGYSMTIVDFYEIVKTTASGKTFIVKHLKDKIVSGNGMQGKSVPVKGEYESNEEIRARVNKYNRVKIDHSSLSLWNGEPVYFDHLD